MPQSSSTGSWRIRCRAAVGCRPGARCCGPTPHSWTGLALADYDVLAQLAEAHGDLRMTELADRALISRSGMSRRVARLVDEGLVRRDRAGTDARGVVVALTEAGTARLAETAPVHARGISKLFVAQLDDQEFALLERALNKVIVDCSFG